MSYQKKVIVISLGGSLIVPEEIDANFLREFRDFIITQIEKYRFVIISGGGRTSRKYQNVARELTHDFNEVDGDYVGIAANNLNAELLRVVFGESAWNKVFRDLTLPEVKTRMMEYPIVIGGAFEPGHSSDQVAVLAAENVGATEIINLSNIDHVYSADPKADPTAKKLEEISWADYRKIIPDGWVKSGLSTPFDPVASKRAEEAKMKVIIMNGKPLSNLKNHLAGEKFEGTVIS